MTNEDTAAALLALREELGDVLDEFSSLYRALPPTQRVVRWARETALANRTVLVRADVLAPVRQSVLTKGPFEVQRVAELLEVTMHLEMEQLSVRPCRVSVVVETRYVSEPHYRITLVGAIVDEMARTGADGAAAPETSNQGNEDDDLEYF